VLERAQVERFDASGRRISLLQGQVMSHFEQGDRLTVQALQLAAQDALGRHLHAQAREGRYEGATSVVDLLGSARVTATPAAGVGGASAGLARGPLTFEGEALRIDVDAQVLSSDRAVLLRSSQGQMRGGSLNYQAKEGLGTLSGRVQGSLRGRAE
jgi:LPS export ABC transporter protein LptC